MRFACFVLLLSAVAIAANSAEDQPEYDVVPNPRFGLINVNHFQNLVNFIEYQMSPRDIDDMISCIPEAIAKAEETPVAEDEEEEAMSRSLSSAIPWGKITDAVKKMASGNRKFSKVLNLVSDPKFRDLVKKTVNSHTLAEFVKDVAEHGFSWTEFLHLLLHALCSAATTIQHDRYSVGVCQVLQNL